MNTNERWWTVVPNSVRFIDDIAAVLKGGSSVIYSISENCEWKDTLRDIIKAKSFLALTRRMKYREDRLEIALPENT